MLDVQQSCRGGSRQDRNVADLPKRQHVSLVTGNHQVRATGNRGCKDKVVVRIRGESYWREVGDNFANYFQTGKQVLRVFRRDICTKVLTTQDNSQLAELRYGSDQRHAIVLECRQQTTRRTVW